MRICLVWSSLATVPFFKLLLLCMWDVEKSSTVLGSHSHWVTVFYRFRSRSRHISRKIKSREGCTWPQFGVPQQNTHSTTKCTKVKGSSFLWKWMTRPCQQPNIKFATPNCIMTKIIVAALCNINYAIYSDVCALPKFFLADFNGTGRV